MTYNRFISNLVNLLQVTYIFNGIENRGYLLLIQSFFLDWESLHRNQPRRNRANTPNNLKQFIIPNFQTLSSRKNLWNYDGKVSKVIGHATYSLKLILIRSRTSVGLWTYASTHKEEDLKEGKRSYLETEFGKKKPTSMLSKDSKKHLSAETYWVYNSDLKLPAVWY